MIEAGLGERVLDGDLPHNVVGVSLDAGDATKSELSLGSFTVQNQDNITRLRIPGSESPPVILYKCLVVAGAPFTPKVRNNSLNVVKLLSKTSAIGGVSPMPGLGCMGLQFTR